MRRITFLVPLILLSQAALAQLPDAFEVVRDSPALVNGRIYLKNDMVFSKEKIPLVRSMGPTVSSKARAEREIDFAFNDTQIQVTSANGIQVDVNGMKVNVTKIYYDSSTKKFQVLTSFAKLPGLDAGIIKLPEINIHSTTLEQKIQEQLVIKLQPKLDAAFKEIQTIRKQKNIYDTQTILSKIVGIFKNGDGPEAPDYYGAMTLQKRIGWDVTASVGIAEADFKKNQDIFTTIDFHSEGSAFKLDALRMYAPEGIKFRRNESGKKAMSATIRGISLTPTSGFQVDGDNTGDGLLSAVVSLYNVIDSAASMRDPSLRDCTELTLVQRMLDSSWEGSVKDYVRAHRATLLAAGFSATLLNSIENQAPQQGVNYMDFLPVPYDGRNVLTR